MDAYLSQEALQALRALSLISSNPDGIVLGHKRGQRFIIEKVLSSQKSFFPSLEKFFELNRLLDNKVLGFFSFHPEKNKLKKILSPFAYGMLFLKMGLIDNRKLEVKSYVIDYKKEFFLKEIKLKSHKFKEKK
jgi:hypothetical protein